MMAGAAFLVTGPTDFIAGFVISELISYIATLKMEDFRMVKKATLEVMAYVRSIGSRAIASLGAYLPSRRSLLKSL